MDAAKNSGCPFAGMAAAATQQLQSMCPFSGAAAKAPAAAVCPLGFGTARGPRLSTLHCPVCKGLLFDAHSITSCKHTFCRSCISQTHDCPSCGRDVDGLQPNSELAGLVDTFLDTHSQSPNLVAAQADLGPLPDNSAASFFMAQGLKSLSGGNIHAAMHRLGRAKQALLDSSLAPHTPAGLAPASAAAAAAASAGPEGGASTGAPTAVGAAADAVVEGEEIDSSMVGVDSTPVREQQQQPGNQRASTAVSEAVSRAVQLATVCGCLGDCYQRLGDTQQAEDQYRESVAAVQPYSEESAEAAHAMSVSLNKLGDARYLAQQLPAAKALYRQALELRQLCCGPLTSGQAGPQQQLELAASLVKVADVCKALGGSSEADQALRRAHGVCCEVQALGAAGHELPAHVSRKLQMLLGVLQAQGAGAAQGAVAAAAGDV